MEILEGPIWTADGEIDINDLRLFLEDICCDLVRFQESSQVQVDNGLIRIDREFNLGDRGFADIRVQVPGKSPYFVEVKYGHPSAAITKNLIRKYANPTDGTKVILVINVSALDDWARHEREIRQALSLELEVWDEPQLLAQVAERFGVKIDSVSAANLVDLRNEIERAKGFLAFGGTSRENYENDPLRANLLWQFSFWRLGQLRTRYGLAPGDILRPGIYKGVVVMLADLCSFSSYVRDTSDPRIVAHNLTSFYTKSRYQVVNHGGMLSQFVGDEVVAFFGLPDQRADFMLEALNTAQAMLDIGQSIAHDWQRRIDRVQASGGAHVGMAIGDLQVFPQRPFSRTHMAEVGDAINLAARLMASAGPNEISMSNQLYREMRDSLTLPFEEQEPLEAKNVGRIKAWKYTAPAHA
jgi:class 3 adenylate cyclase